MRGPITYAPPRPDERVDLDLSRNEGSRPGTDLLFSLDGPERLLRSYPDVTGLTADIARAHGVVPDHVLVTAGSDDGLLRCMLSLARSAGSVITTYPTFEMIPIYAAQLGITLKEVPWWGEEFPVGQLLSLIGADTSAVVLVSPNNPTGNIIGPQGLRAVADEVPLVVLDAAYAEYADADLTRFASSLGNVLVSRTFSKAWGLAGLRVGYLIGNPDAIRKVGSFGSPYAVSALSASLARKRMATAQIDQYLRGVRANRTDLIDLLEELGAQPLPSQGNFVLAEVPHSDWLVAAAGSLGVGLREFPGRPGLERCVRITVPGDDEEYQRLCRALRSALAPDAILFDIDGVLADISSSQTQAIIETAATFDVLLTADEVSEARLAGNANDDWELTRRLCEASGVVATVEEVTSVYETLYQGGNGRPGLKERESLLVEPEFLRRLAKQYPIGIVTGRPRADAVEFLRRFRLEPVISTLVTREDAPLKPDPAPVSTAMSRLGVKTAWMVGDTPDDIAAARSAGVVPIGVTAPGDPFETVSEALRDAGRILESVVELEEILS